MILTEDSAKRMRNLVQAMQEQGQGAVLAASFGHEAISAGGAGGHEDSLLMDMLCGHSSRSGLPGGETGTSPTLNLMLLQLDELPSHPQDSAQQYFLVQQVAYSDLTQLRGARQRQAANTDLRTLCLRIGLPGNIQGFDYIVTAVEHVLRDPAIISRITTSLYPAIAKAHATSASKVERSIRHAIKKIWQEGQVELLNDEFGCTVCSQEKRMTNGQFIALLSRLYSKPT